MNSAAYEKRASRDRLRTLLIGLGVGCALSALIFSAKYRSSKSKAAAPPAGGAAGLAPGGALPATNPK